MSTTTDELESEKPLEEDLEWPWASGQCPTSNHTATKTDKSIEEKLPCRSIDCSYCCVRFVLSIRLDLCGRRITANRRSASMFPPRLKERMSQSTSATRCTWATRFSRWATLTCWPLTFTSGTPKVRSS